MPVDNRPSYEKDLNEMQKYMRYENKMYAEEVEKRKKALGDKPSQEDKQKLKDFKKRYKRRLGWIHNLANVGFTYMTNNTFWKAFKMYPGEQWVWPLVSHGGHWQCVVQFGSGSVEVRSEQEGEYRTIQACHGWTIEVGDKSYLKNDSEQIITIDVAVYEPDQW